MEKSGKLLVVDDNEDVLFALHALLSSYLEKVKVTTDPEQIPRFINDFQPDVILLDMNFQKEVASGKEGFYWLDTILQIDRQMAVLLMTAYADTDKAVQAIKSGAIDFIPKPWEKDKLLATIHSALKLRKSQKEVALLRQQVQTINNGNSREIIGESEEMRKIYGIIGKLADTDANILLMGENGTGKDLIARTIHNHSRRAGEAFVTIDLGSIAESLFESELFGYEKGAFTDARKEKQGRIEIASGGTLFLDEIANLSAPMQAKLLTTIEKRYISRLGSVKNIPIDVRFIAATNADLYQSVEDGTFRRDLLYRMNTIEIQLPPLREREGDISLLADHFLKRYAAKYKKEIRGLSPDARKKLEDYPWPGNVRELQNVIERAVVLSSSKTLTGDDLMLTVKESRKAKDSENLNLERVEQETIEKALQRSKGNMNRAAELLGISRFALYRKINRK
ncbi:sigma-54 dependent transcriptional regulator [Parabacteroides sp. Marseille-P3160]|uniref:sigma-54-dependent transcriptional regulator n=1 Tax=Parabacteroides sp. Marseille-P3160 TaxID=1917887 RepID=UPI0009BC4A4E|nr:sigma-54 dependent transcriptional regulator [Parabacteroides sp. Marseille-P3160]